MLDIVLVNWNSGDDLRACLEALRSANGSELVRRVVVVDNASGDGSSSGLPEGLPLDVIRNETNVGFAAACNRGAARGSAPYLLFLNVDVVPTPEAFVEVVRFMEDERNAGVGICGVRLTAADGTVLPSVARFPSPAAMVGHALGLDRVAPRVWPPHFLSVEEHGATRDVDQVMGAFFCVRRALFEELGGFDERFFVFYEELDLSLRAARAGWRSVYLPAVSVVHDAEADRATAVRIYLSRRGRVLYAHKHFGRPAAASVAVATLLLEPAVRCAWQGLRGDWKGIGVSLRGFGRLWREGGALLTGRTGKVVV